MTKISREEVAELAQGIRIGLREDETGDYAKRLSQMVADLEVLWDAPVQGLPPTYYGTSLTNVMRPDTVGKVLDRDRVLAGAPEEDEGMFEVPQILEED